MVQNIPQSCPTGESRRQEYLPPNSQQSLGEDHTWDPVAHPTYETGRLEQRVTAATERGTMGQGTLER